MSKIRLLRGFELTSDLSNSYCESALNFFSTNKDKWYMAQKKISLYLSNWDYTSTVKMAFFDPKITILETLGGLCSHKNESRVLKLHTSHFLTYMQQKSGWSSQNKILPFKRDSLIYIYMYVCVCLRSILKSMCNVYM